MREGELYAAFLVRNRDLIENLIGVLRKYYSEERLKSPEAAVEYIEPDLQPLPIVS
jgi:hypothetical protein